MDLIKEAAKKLGKEFWKHKRVGQFKDDFIGALIDWIEPIFLKSDPEMVKELEEGPAGPATEDRLEARLRQLIAQDPDFLARLQDKMRPITRKNVAELDSKKVEIDSDVEVGDRGNTDQDTDEKNVLRTKGEEVKIKGGLRIGDQKKD